MKTIGIIAEYNPFHNGHAYQIAELKRKTNADFVVIAMSGDFVQRGAPAIIDKYCRAEMALLCGADLVIELPAVWAVSSAEDFAMAGVTLFDKMGCIDGICFGAESDQLPQLKSIAGVLAEEPDIYRSALSSYLKKGLAFPAARAAALSDYFKSTGMNFLISILDTPNNILAVEYLKALKRRNSAMTPILIPRRGADIMIPRSTHRQLLPLPSARQFLMLHHRMIILSIFHLQITVHRVFIPAGHIFRKLHLRCRNRLLHFFKRRSHPADLWMLMTFPPFLATGSYRAAKRN